MKDFFEIEKKMYPLKIWPGGSGRQREAAGGSVRISSYFSEKKEKCIMFCVIQPRHCISTIVPASPDLRRSFIVEKKSSNFASKLTKIAFFTSAGTALIGVDRNPIQNPQFFW